MGILARSRYSDNTLQKGEEKKELLSSNLSKHAFTVTKRMLEFKSLDTCKV